VVGSIIYCIQMLGLDPNEMRQRIAPTPDHPITKLSDSTLRIILMISVALGLVEGVVCLFVGVMCLKQKRAGVIAGIFLSAFRLVIAGLGVLLGLVTMAVRSMEIGANASAQSSGYFSLIVSIASMPVLISTIVFLAIGLKRAKKIPPQLPTNLQIV